VGARNVQELSLLCLLQIAILKDCRNVHVVQFLGACMHPGCTMLITELMAANAQDLIHSGQLAWKDKCAPALALHAAADKHPHMGMESRKHFPECLEAGLKCQLPRLSERSLPGVPKAPSRMPLWREDHPGKTI
jgi:hypothetical protein